MRGTKAKALRRAAMHPDLKNEMKEEIRSIAVERNTKMHEAGKARKVAISLAQTEYKRAKGEAWSEFENKRAKIVARYEKRDAAKKELVNQV